MSRRPGPAGQHLDSWGTDRMRDTVESRHLDHRAVRGIDVRSACEGGRHVADEWPTAGDARPAETGIEASETTLPGPHLVSTRGDWLLSEGSNVVGRDRDCAVRIDSPSVSRHHARILVTQGEATIEDLGSKNGTYVNEQPIKGAPVALDDRVQIRFGSVTMTYRILSALPSTVTQRPV